MARQSIALHWNQADRLFIPVTRSLRNLPGYRAYSVLVEESSPWLVLTSKPTLFTPGWHFSETQLRSANAFAGLEEQTYVLSYAQLSCSPISVHGLEPGSRLSISAR